MKDAYKHYTLFALSFGCLILPSHVSFAEEEEEISFYGQRSVVAPAEQQGPATTFHRRVIAPVIEDTEAILEAVTPKITSKDHSQSSPKLSVFTLQAPDELFSVTEEYELTRNELLLAKKAQYYFTRNHREDTGLWDSVQGYNHTTMWDIASGIAALLALEALELRTSEQTLFSLRQTLETLQTIPLYNDTLPNREYNTKTGLPSGRLSSHSSNGSGWSALDIGRLLIWLKILGQQHPELIDDIDTIVETWELEQAIHKGTLFGTNLSKGREHYRQEGRNGYLQYAAEGFRLFDFDVPLPDLDDYLSYVDIDGLEVQIDTRNVPYLTSDPYVLAGIEYGDRESWSQLDTFYQLHKARWLEDGTLTSYAEDAMNKNPWFAYNNLYYYGKPWVSVSPSGKTVENPQILSNKVAFGFSVLFEDSFSLQLFDAVLNNSLQYRSIPTGVYANGGSNAAFNINTNSLILVALWYKKNGSKPIYSQMEAKTKTELLN